MPLQIWPQSRSQSWVPQADATDANSTVVRMLSVGQQVKGTVKRVTEFGAFVDIGVGRDGLVHISELSAKRVGKVSDVLQEGQEVDLWIKKLDRDRNRISLTMIEPGKRTIRDLQKGEVVEGTVTRILPYGAFVDIGIGRDALLHVREMGEGFIAKPEDVVQVGQLVEVRVIEIARRRSRVDLSMKGLRPEPEAPQQASHGGGRMPLPHPSRNRNPKPSTSTPTSRCSRPMQLAFKRAQEKSGVVLPTSTKAGKQQAPEHQAQAGPAGRYHGPHVEHRRQKVGLQRKSDEAGRLPRLFVLAFQRPGGQAAMDMQGKVALVTGGAVRVGKAITLMLAHSGRTRRGQLQYLGGTGAGDRGRGAGARRGRPGGPV